LRQKLLTAIRYALLFTIGLVLLWLTFRHENLSDIFTRISTADPFWLVLSLLLALVAFVSRAVRWVILMEPLGIKPRLAPTMYSLMIGYFANLAIPRIGEITRCGSLAKAEKLPFNKLIGTVIVERVIDLIMLFFTMTLVAILEYDVLSGFLKEKIVGPLAARTNGIYGIVIIAGILLSGLAAIVFIIRKGGNNKFILRIRKVMDEIFAGLKSVLRMKNNGWFLFHTFFIWFIYFLMTYVCFYCLESTSHLDIKAGMFVLVIGGLGMSAPVQGGIGAFHYIVSQGLQLFGVSSTDGIVYATLVHTSQTLLVVVLGTLSLILLFLYERKDKQMQESGTSVKDH
jgi:glycosyltransferase 2 family protein